MGNSEFTKTSLHNHFGGVFAENARGNNGSKFVFDIEHAKKKIDDAHENEYKLLGLTNHNCFWKNEYDLLVQYIQEQNYDIELIPGSEFDVLNIVKGKNHYLHVVLLISPNSDLDLFASDINDFIRDNGEPAITIEQLTTLACKNKCILIPHGKKQKTKGLLKNLPTFDNFLSIKDFFPILIEDNKSAQREVLESQIRAHITSDDFEWLTQVGSISTLDQLPDFSSIIEPTYIWGEPSFDSLFYCAIMGKDRVMRESDIIEKNKYIKKVEIVNNGGVLKDSTLLFSHGMNSIIGNSGSGKTLLLNLIKLKLTGKNLSNSISTTDADYSELYNDIDVIIYDNEDNPVDVGDINVFEGENLYKQIVSTLTYDKNKLLKDLNATPTFEETEKLVANFNANLNDYITDRIKINKKSKSIDNSLIKYFASIDYLKSNKRVQGSIEYIIDSKIKTKQKDLSKKIKTKLEDIDKTKSSFEVIDELIKNYKLDEEELALNSIRFKLLKRILSDKNNFNNEFIRIDANLMFKNKLVEIISEYNETIGQRTKTVNDSKQIIGDEAEKIVNELKQISLTRNQLLVPILEEEKLLESVKKNDEIIKLSNFTINKNIEYEDIVEYFDSAIGTGQGKILKSEFSNAKGKNDDLYPINLFNHDSVKRFSEKFIEKEYSNNNMFRLNSDKFIKFDILIRDLEGDYKQISSLSAGQLSKIYINLLIDNKLKAMENNAVILYDQPDNNLEKTFILDTLGRKLADLKQRYQVIITTHEPLLVINSDSNSIVKAENDPIAGENNISYDNLTMYDVGDKLAAIEKIAQLIDGSHKAIKKRNQIYGGFNL